MMPRDPLAEAQVALFRESLRVSQLRAVLIEAVSQHGYDGDDHEDDCWIHNARRVLIGSEVPQESSITPPLKALRVIADLGSATEYAPIIAQAALDQEASQ